MKRIILIFFAVVSSAYAQESCYLTSGVFISNDNFIQTEEGIYISNSYQGGLSFLPINGESGWTKTFSNPQNFQCLASSIAKCNLSNHLIFYYHSLYENESRIVKLEPDGTVLWSKKINYPFFEYIISNNTPLTINNNDEITVSTSFLNGKQFLCKLDSNGNLIFSKQITFPQISEYAYGRTFLAIDNNSYLVTLKTISGAIIFKTDENMQVLWSQNWYIGSPIDPQHALQLSNGHFLISGTYSNFDPSTFVVEMDEMGSILSYKTGIPASYTFAIRAIDDQTIETLDYMGNGAIINLSSNEYSFTHRSDELLGGPRFVNEKPSTILGNNFFCVNLDSNQMNCISGQTGDSLISTSSTDQWNITDIAIDVDDIGTLSDYIPVLTTIEAHMVVGCFLGTEKESKATFSLFPNPAASSTSIHFENIDPSCSELRIITISGQILSSHNVNNSKGQFTLPGFQSSGLYLVQLVDKKGIIINVEKLIIK